MKKAIVTLATIVGSAASIAVMIYIDESVKAFREERRRDKKLKEALRQHLSLQGYDVL